MSLDPALAARVRRLCGAFTAEAVSLAADLLNAVERARDILAEAADDPSPAGQVAAIAHSLLADAAASARPLPAPEPAQP